MRTFVRKMKMGGGGKVGNKKKKYNNIKRVYVSMIFSFSSFKTAILLW